MSFAPMSPASSATMSMHAQDPPLNLSPIALSQSDQPHMSHSYSQPVLSRSSLHFELPYYPSPSPRRGMAVHLSSTTGSSDLGSARKKLALPEEARAQTAYLKHYRDQYMSGAANAARATGTARNLDLDGLSSEVADYERYHDLTNHMLNVTGPL